MKVIHITPKTKGYEIVELLANRYDRKNHLAVIIDADGQESFTGGLLFQNTKRNRELFDSIDKDEIYDFAKDLRMEPFKKFYFTE